MPSIDAQAKQQKLKSLVQQYKNSDGKKRVFDDTVQFPTEFIIKVIGVNDDTLLQDTLQAVAQCIGQQPSAIKHSLKYTEGNQYVSISLMPYFTKSDELYAAYAAVGKDSRVKYVI